MEHDFHKWLRDHSSLNKPNEGVLVGIGDDGAILPGSRADTVITTDTIAEGTHFDPSVHSLELIGRKALAVNLSETVLPLTMSSTAAARLLDMMQWTIDVIYVDTAHEQGDTLVELHYYYSLLRPGGLLLGDDYEWFPSVNHDVDVFARCVNASVVLLGDIRNVWALVK